MGLTEMHRVLLRAAFGERELTVTRLSGGLHGRCFRVTSPGFDYAVRMPAPDEGSFRLDSRTEQRVIAAVAAAGLAPPVAPLPPELGLVATRFIAGGRPWSAADAGEPRNIERLARRLKALHALELELEPFAVVAAADDYACVAASRIELTAEQRRWSAELLGLAADFEASFAPTVPCHNDLVASNVVDNGQLWLVDFEYAASSAPILDLAGLAGLNDFDARQRGRLVEAYYEREDVPFDVEQLDAAIRLVRLLAYFWVLAYGAGEDLSETEMHTDKGAGFAAAMAAMLR